MAELITKDPQQLAWTLQRLPGYVKCSPESTEKHSKDVLTDCPDKQFCLGLGSDWKAEFCLYTPENMDKMKQLKREELRKFADKPKVHRVRIRRHQGGPYRINYYAPRYQNPEPILTNEVMTANPFSTVQLLGEIGGARCGPYVTPIMMQNCPQHQFCRTPEGHEMCFYGPWQANETTMKF